MVVKHENEALGEFVSVTQADPEVAKHILEAYAWNVEDAISFYLETGGVDVVVNHGSGVAERADPAGVRRQAWSHPIDVVGDDDVRLDREDDEAIDIVEEQGDEDEEDYEQEEEEDIKTLASFRSRRATASHPVNYNEDSDDDMDIEDAYGDEEERFKYGRRERRGHRRSLRRVQQTQQAENAGQVPQDILNLPDVNIEEQKMLLSAMTGEAYEGSLPDFSHHGYNPPQRQLSPSVIERQILREEQDKALQESLKRDKEREIESEIAKVKEMEREESQRLEKRALEEDLQRKRERLPPEPEDSDTDSFVLVIRMPSGTRLKRRFSRRDDISAAFDFIDVHSSESDCLLPGTYHLVSQFPRKIYTSIDAGKFADGDFSHKQEALFVERTS